MSFFDLFLPKEKTAGKAQMAFDHPKVYNQLSSGPGPQGLSMLAHSVSKRIVSHLEAMDANLQRALKTSQGAWSGHASDSATGSTTPLSEAVQASRDNSAEIGKHVEQQTEHFGKVKTMPPPKKVESMDLGLAGATLPGFLVEQADKEIKERQANAVEEAARQQYTTYQESTQSTTGNMTRYSPVPNPLTSIGAAETRPPGTINPDTGDPGGGGGGGGGDVTGSTEGAGDSSGGSGGSGGGSGGSGSSGGGSEDRVKLDPAKHFPYEHVIMDDWGGPSDTDSQSHTPPPPAPPGQTPPSGPAPSTTGGGGGGGSVGIMPGAGGALAGGGAGGAGARGSMSGRLGPGGSSGIGGTGSSAGAAAGTSASGARGGSAGGAMGGAGGRGRGGEEDEEHQRKYVEDSDEPFEFDGEVDEEGNVVAPPVIGQHRPPSHYQ